MKRIVALALVLILAMSVLAGCGAPEDPAAQEKDYALSVGVKVTETLGSSKIAQTVASIVTDKDGKIVVCRLDCIEYTAYQNGDLVTASPTSKVAQGEDYDPNNYMTAGDWYKQAAALEQYVVGKTKSEVAAIALTNGYVNDTELKASCSINVADLLSAMDNAFDNEHKTAFKSKATSFTAGLVAQAAITVTEEDTTDVKFAVDYAAAVLADGKVAAAILDCAEPTLVSVSTEGAEDLTYAGTKLEQGEDYDKNNYMAAGDWYKQAAAYAKTAVGKTKDDIATLAASGVAGCTIYAGGFKATIEAAVKGAR